MDHARNDFPGALQAQRDVEHRESVGEIGGAVERIDIPPEVRRAFVSAAFFGDNAVRRKMGPQTLYHELLTRAVGFGDEIEIALQFERNPAFEVVRQQRAALARDFHRRLEIGH